MTSENVDSSATLQVPPRMKNDNFSSISILIRNLFVYLHRVS